MDQTLLKTGATSILLGSKHYGGFIPPQVNKLLKVTRRIIKHDEFKYLHIVRTIKNYKDYYSIPDEEFRILKPSDVFYSHLMNLIKHERMDLFKGELECCMIDYAGQKDLLDTIGDLSSVGYSIIWRSPKDILRFSQKMLQAISYLHEKKLAHLDIKPENVVVNMRKKEFKIIDFGFTSLYPFDDYVKDPRGTPSYFPKQFRCDHSSNWLPAIEANDAILIDSTMPMVKNRDLVYKVDSFCLGRVLYMLWYIYNDNFEPECFCFGQSKTDKIDNMISDLLENDCNKRITIRKCLEKYFS